MRMKLQCLSVGNKDLVVNILRRRQIGNVKSHVMQNASAKIDLLKSIFLFLSSFRTSSFSARAVCNGKKVSNTKQRRNCSKLHI